MLIKSKQILANGYMNIIIGYTIQEQVRFILKNKSNLMTPCKLFQFDPQFEGLLAEASGGINTKFNVIMELLDDPVIEYMNYKISQK